MTPERIAEIEQLVTFGELDGPSMWHAPIRELLTALKARDAQVAKLRFRLETAERERDSLRHDVEELGDDIAGAKSLLDERDKLRAQCSRQRKELRAKDRKILELRGAEVWFRGHFHGSSAK